MRRGSALLPTLLLCLASGCATQSEDQRSEPAVERDYEAQEQPAALEAVAPAESEDVPRTLAELERERASNNARLRELGVELPVAQPELADEAATKSADPGGGDGAGGHPAPSVAPAPNEPGKKPSTMPRRDKSSEKKGEKRGDKKDKAAGGATPQDDAELDWDGARPEEAKVAPPSSTHELDAAARCQQVCDLAAISCGLGDEICELANRHPGDHDYASACERANLDCEAAKEACDACAQ